MTSRCASVPLLLVALGVLGACDAARPEGGAPAAGPGGGPVTTADPDPSETEPIPMVSVRVFDDSGELVGPLEVPMVVKSEEAWRAQLTPEQYRITRRAGTEPPFCGTLLDNKKEGVYSCVCCGLPLFSSSAKFHSGTGWPSFFQPIARENVSERVDRSHGMVRSEINCARCDAHLGHVFDDGPAPTGLRFCLNSESLAFTDETSLASLADPAVARGD